MQYEFSCLKCGQHYSTTVNTQIWCQECGADKPRLVNQFQDGKPLESPVGSGAMTCCGGRGAGDQQGSVEEEGAQRLNREDWRVAPGKAEAWAVEFLQFLDACAANSERWKAIAIEEMRLSDVNHEEGRAAAYRHAAANFRLSMPKPDSGDPKERSGRRNANVEAPMRKERQ